MDNKQHIVLKYMLDNNQWIDVTHDLIFTGDCLKIKHLMTSTLKEGRSTSVQQIGIVLKELQDREGLKTLKQVHETPSIDRAVFEELRLQLRHEAQLRITKQLSEVNEIKHISEALKDLQALEQDDKPKELNEPINFKQWSKHIAPEHNYLDSGIEPLLDTGTDFKLGDVVNFLAASGNFKTGMMTRIAKDQILKGRNVLFYSMEETAQSLQARIGGMILRKTPYQYSQLTEDELEDKFKSISLGELDVISGEVILIEEMADAIKELEAKRGYKYDYIIPDYSAMIEVKNASKQAREDQLISKVFRELKMIATNQNKVVVTAIQANRDGYGKNKSPRVENTSASMGGVHVADLMLSLKYSTNPDAIVRPTLADVEPNDVKGFIKLTVRKKRTGTISVDDAFIFTHKADGNSIFEDRMTTDMENFELWDNLFDVE